MLEIVAEILEAEQKAAEIVKEAQETAVRRKTRSESEANARLLEAQGKEKAAAQKRLEMAREAASARIEAELAADEAERGNFTEAHYGEIEELVKRIASFAVTPEFEKE